MNLIHHEPFLYHLFYLISIPLLFLCHQIPNEFTRIFIPKVLLISPSFVPLGLNDKKSINEWITYSPSQFQQSTPGDNLKQTKILIHRTNLHNRRLYWSSINACRESRFIIVVLYLSESWTLDWLKWRIISHPISSYSNKRHSRSPTS